jgi:DNA-binding NarL/FixJ family response regulator
MKTITVMIIDEHRDVRHALKILLNTRQEIDVIAALATIDKGEISAERTYPNVILLGLGSSDDNADTLDIVARFTKLGVAVVILSLYPGALEEKMFYQAGAKNYISKDINIPSLIAAIRDAVAPSGLLLELKDDNPAKYYRG